MSNSVIAPCSRGRGSGKSSRNRGSSSKGRGNRKPSKAADDYQWGTIYNFVNTNVTAHLYLETSGPARSINENLQPLEFFYKTVSQKNYSTDCSRNQSLLCSKSTKHQKQIYEMDWSHRNWVVSFLWSNIVMALTNLVEIKDYWSTSSFISMSWFRSIFTHGRFEQILTFLHLVNNENNPPRENPEYKLY